MTQNKTRELKYFKLLFPKGLFEGRRHMKRKMCNVTSGFTPQPRSSANCMYITTGRKEVRGSPGVSVQKQDPMRQNVKCGNDDDANPTAASKNLLGSEKKKKEKVWKTTQPSNPFISLSYSKFRDVIRGVYKKREGRKDLAHVIINRTLALQVPSDWKADTTQTSTSLRRQM